MPVALAATWNPRGELVRFARWAGQICSLYEAVEIVAPPHADASVLEQVRAIPGIHLIQTESWGPGRHTALRRAYESGASHIHYCDFDRLLHWVEVYPDDLHDAVSRIATMPADCLVMGRTEQAWETHPRSMRETEHLFNRVFSVLLGADMDFGAGTKAFTREAASFVLRHSPPETGSFAADTAWPLLLHRAGYRVDYVALDSLAWETPDQWRDTVASEEDRQQAAETANRDPDHWRARVEIARRILEAGLAVLEAAE